MSSQNGNKARFNRLRKAKIARRLRASEQVKVVAKVQPAVVPAA